METLLRDTYRTLRNRRPALAATTALQLAREAVAAGKGARYGFHKLSGAYNPPFAGHGHKHLRWVESVDRAGLRRVGFADEIARRHGSRSIDHNGWFADMIQSEIIRGAVYQLPGRNGKARYVYGYDDPNNEGAALLCFDVIEGERLEWSGDLDESEFEAAKFADGLAEKVAEEEREYDDAWHKANEWAELGDEMKDARKSAYQLVRDLRAARTNAQTATASICDALRAQVRALLQQWEDARERRENLASDFYFWRDGKSQTVAEFAATNL